MKRIQENLRLEMEAVYGMIFLILDQQVKQVQLDTPVIQDTREIQDTQGIQVQLDTPVIQDTREIQVQLVQLV